MHAWLFFVCWQLSEFVIVAFYCYVSVKFSVTFGYFMFCWKLRIKCQFNYSNNKGLGIPSIVGIVLLFGLFAKIILHVWNIWFVTRNKSSGWSILRIKQLKRQINQKNFFRFNVQNVIYVQMIKFVWFFAALESAILVWWFLF